MQGEYDRMGLPAIAILYTWLLMHRYVNAVPLEMDEPGFFCIVMTSNSGWGIRVKSWLRVSNLCSKTVGSRLLSRLYSTCYVQEIDRDTQLHNSWICVDFFGGHLDVFLFPVRCISIHFIIAKLRCNDLFVIAWILWCNPHFWERIPSSHT